MNELTIELPDRTYTIGPPAYPGAAFSRNYVSTRNRLIPAASKRAFEAVPEARGATKSHVTWTKWGIEFSRAMNDLSKDLFVRAGQ